MASKTKSMFIIPAGLILVLGITTTFKWGSALHSEPTPTTPSQTSPNTGLSRITELASPVRVSSFQHAVNIGFQLGSPPNSLNGTEVDGSLKIDAIGNLILDSDLRQLFDYFLATIGEEPLTDISARVALHIKQNLNPPATEQAWQVFQSYLNYKEQLGNLQQHDGTFQGMRDSITQQQALRVSILGPELATAFFQEEDEFANFLLAKIEIDNNPNLSQNEKEDSIDQLLASLPEHSRNIIQPQTNPLAIEEKVIQRQAQGASDYEIWQFREQQLGADAANRLALLDQRRQRWSNHYTEYRIQYMSIMESKMSNSDTVQATDNLRLQYFSERELKRVQMLDKQHDGS